MDGDENGLVHRNSIALDIDGDSWRLSCAACSH